MVKVIAFVSIAVVASAVGLFILFGGDFRGERPLEIQIPENPPQPNLDAPQTLLSIWNMTSETSRGDLIVEITYVDQSPGASLLPPRIRRINLGSGLAVAGYHDVGVVNFRAAVSPDSTFHLKGVKLVEGVDVKLTLTDSGFEYR